MRSVKIECLIHQGAFSGERGVTIAAPDGVVIYDGCVPVDYLRTFEGDRLTDDVPAAGQPIQGWLSVQGTSGNKYHLPDGTVLRGDVLEEKQIET